MPAGYLNPQVGQIIWNDSIDDRKRGFNVYSTSSLVGVTGMSKSGNMLTLQTDDPYFELSVEDRFDIYKKSSIVFGIVTGRMNRISATSWEVVPEKKVEDRLADEMKFQKTIYDELRMSKTISHLFVKAKIHSELTMKLPDLLPDLSNFDSAILRWKKRIQFQKMDQAEEISDWLWEPNKNETWIEFQKKWIQDLMIHGADAMYVETDQDNEVLGYHHLPGGSVLPLKEKYVGATNAYAQILDTYQGQIFFGDEMIWTAYYPTSSRAYPMIPLEALINKIAESLLFDQKMAGEADGTKPPEKLVVFGEKPGFQGFDDPEPIGMDVNKQARIEHKLSEKKKEAIITLTGVGTPVVTDISKRDTIPAQLERQKMVREETAIVFNASNMEVNLTGSGDTSGRSTSEAQGEIDKSKGYYPIALLLQTKTNRQLIKRKFGSGYAYQYKEGQDEMAELQKLKLKKDSGLYSVNEIRTGDLNEAPFDGEEFDKPSGVGEAGAPGESEMSPLFVSQN